MCEEKKPKINDRDVNALQIKKKKKLYHFEWTYK